MQKKFLTNLSLLLFLNLLVKPFWVLGIDRGVQNAVGAESYGFYFAILNFSFLFNILLDFGITNFNNRNIAQNHQLLNKHFSSIVILKFLLAAVYFLVTFSIGLLLKYNSQQLLILVFLGFNQFLLSFILYLRSNISGLLMFKTDSIISVLDRILMILFCGILLWGNITKIPFRIEWFVYSQTTAYLITIAIAAGIVATRASFKKLHWNMAFFVMIIKRSFPFAILVLLMTFYNRIDSVMIERLLRGTTGNEQTGIYASAYRLLDATNMIAYLFAVLLLPLFARMIKNKEPVEKLVKLSFTMLVTVATVVAIVAIFYGHDIMSLLYPIHENESAPMFAHRIEQSSQIFGILMCGFIAISTTYVFGTLLTANGNLKYLNLIAAGGMFLNILLNLILIPRMFATGAAITSLITQGITAFLQVMLTQYIFRFKINYVYLLRLVVFILGAVLIGWILSKTGLWWVKSLLLTGVLILLLSAVLKLMNIKSFINILRG
ncbi:MAG: oligosaccharide flippase family protein [Bacteroidales bacterium]|nr:oligosaccharide flippase family protein [Bacteroidales bacterium]